MNSSQLRVAVKKGEIDTVIAAFPDLYGRLMGKRLDANYFLDHALQGGVGACDYLFTVDMEMNPVSGYAFANWEKGYGDVHLNPDLKTLRRAAWLEKTAFVFCDSLKTAVAPRTMLRTQLTRLKEAGFEAQAASELEYFLYNDDFRSAFRKNYSELTPAGDYLEDYHILQGTREEEINAPARRALRDSEVPVENSKGEWGRGQHELNIRYAEALEAADRHILLKQCIKEIALQKGRSATFMAKVGESQAGSSCHIHLSLWRGKTNAFAGKKKIGPILASDQFRWFLGGWMKRLPELMAFFAPTVNSYKRFLAASWAPTRLAWSHDNRTAGFRIVGAGPSLRIECRVPGADCNPYLAYSAAVAAGLDGIKNKIEPPPMFSGDAYRAEGIAALPKSLGEAAGLLKASAFARSVFGGDVVEHYARFYKTEQAAYDGAVTDWERRRYFERI